MRTITLMVIVVTSAVSQHGACGYAADVASHADRDGLKKIPRHTVRSYEQNCAACHDMDGRGRELREAISNVPDFSIRKWQRSRSNAQLKASILLGKGTEMPAFEGEITPVEATNLVEFVRSLGGYVSGRSMTSKNDFRRKYQSLRDQWQRIEDQLMSLKRQRDGASSSLASHAR